MSAQAVGDGRASTGFTVGREWTLITRTAREPMAHLALPGPSLQPEGRAHGFRPARVAASSATDCDDSREDGPMVPANSSKPLRILFVEDDLVIGEATLAHLERHRYDAVWVEDGLEAWERFGDPGPAPFDVVLCDVMLPGMDGVTLCRRVREVATTPFVLISARGDAVDVVGGLEAGADDYVVKPFDVQVLLARLRSVVRRAEPAPFPAGTRPDAVQAPGVQAFGDLTLDRSALELRRDGRRLMLTPTEMKLFLELAESPGRVLSRRSLLAQVWDYDEWDGDNHLVDVHIQRLRNKVGNEHIETVRGFGYKLRP